MDSPPGQEELAMNQLGDRRLQGPDVIDPWLAGKALERRLGQPGLNLAGDSVEPLLGVVVVGSRDVNDNLDVCTEAGKRTLAHGDTVQNTARYVKGLRDKDQER